MKKLNLFKSYESIEFGFKDCNQDRLSFQEMKEYISNCLVQGYEIKLSRGINSTLNAATTIKELMNIYKLIDEGTNLRIDFFKERNFFAVKENLSMVQAISHAAIAGSNTGIEYLISFKESVYTLNTLSVKIVNFSRNDFDQNEFELRSCNWKVGYYK